MQTLDSARQIAAPNGQPIEYSTSSLSDAAWLDSLRELVERELKPQVKEIDQGGQYPREFMRNFGALGGFAQSCPRELGGGGRGLKAAIQAMEIVSQECLSTGFCVWCQDACGWYIQHGDSDYLKSCVLPDVLSGERGAGTGLSNPMKHFAGIEKINLHATRREGGYNVSGALPWVSNAGTDHSFAFVARVEENDDYLMGVVPGEAPGLEIGDGGHFIALEGSNTYSAHFRDAFIPDAWILAYPSDSYVNRIRPGFILGQTGFGLGLIADCVALMKKADRRTSHVNCFLDDRAEHIETDLEAARLSIYALAEEIDTGYFDGRTPREGLLQSVIKARITVSELSLRASQAAMLYAGAAGYRSGGAVERKLRESYFVAIVTPALKHLKKLLAAMES